MINKRLAESYALEITARARAAHGRAAQLSFDDFISDAPQKLAVALANTFEYLIKAVAAIMEQIDWQTGDSVEIEQDLRNLRVADEAVKYFSAHLRYVDSARTEKLPWEVIPSFEKLVRDLHGDAQIMLRPMWHYNYATTVTNFFTHYAARLRPFALYLPNDDIPGSVLPTLAPAFHIISFPALERENILLHSLIGHEVGHLLAIRFLTRERVSTFMASVKEEVAQFTDRRIKDEGRTPENMGGELFFVQMRNQRVATNVELVVQFWFRALEELLSDIVGALLFGPAALFATLEMATQFGFDEMPSPQNNFYPPWRTRLKIVNLAAREVCPTLFASSGAEPWFSETAHTRALSDHLDLIASEVASDSDEAGLQGVALARIAYEHVHETLPEARRFLTDAIKTKSHLFDEDALWSALPQLVDRLDHGIPPNAVEMDSLRIRKSKRRTRKAPRSVGLVEIINSSWFHRIVSASSGGSTNEPPEAARRRRNRLTLKAVEYAYIQHEFETWRKAPVHALPVPEPDAMNRVLTEGVLTSPEITVAMRRPRLRERLIVTPLLDPAETVRDAAVDVRLGTEFVILKKQMIPSLNIADASELLRGVERYQQRFVRRIREEIVLHPGQLIIGSTLEYIQVPRGLMCYVIGKSTWGRTGLIIATATKIDPGFRGCVTLEIINDGEVPLVLVPGIPIAQLVFHRTEPDTTYDGVYSCPVGPEFPRFDAIVRAASFWLPDKGKR